MRAARDRGVLFYSGTGNANGVDGDTILIGPPFIVTEDELGRIASSCCGDRDRTKPSAARRSPRQYAARRTRISS